MIWFSELAEWNGFDRRIIDVEIKRKIYCLIRKNPLPLAFLHNYHEFKPSRGYNMIMMDVYRYRLGQVLFMVAMNIKDKLLSQISDEEIIDGIELLGKLELIEKKIRKPFKPDERTNPKNDNAKMLRPFVEVFLNGGEIYMEFNRKNINMLMNSNWAERSDEIEKFEKVWIEHENILSVYWSKVNLNLELQKAESDVYQVIEIESTYLRTWHETILKEIRIKEWIDALQYMDSSIVDLKEERETRAEKKLIAAEFLQNLQEATAQWEEVFCNDNLVIFADESWNSFVKLKPMVDYGDGWKVIAGRKKYRGFNYGRKFKLNMNSWYKLKKIADMISFVCNIDGARNNILYFEKMKCINIDGKVW
jgi:hypothetical protein